MGVVITTSFSVCFYSGSLDDVCVRIKREDLLIFVPGLILIMLMMCILVAN